MATKYAQSNGAYDAAIWYDAASGGNAVDPPGNGDTANPNGKTVTATATIPASGTLLAITSATAGGSITVDLTAGNFAINATTIQSGANPAVSVTGTTSNTITITASAINGGTSGTGIHGVRFNSTGNLVILGGTVVTGGSSTSAIGVSNVAAGNVTIGTTAAPATVTGGTGSESYGVYNVSTGTITINGSVSGAAGVRAYGAVNYVAGTLTINGGTLTNTNNDAVVGKHIFNPSESSYISIPTTSGTGLYYPSGGRYFGDRNGGKG